MADRDLDSKVENIDEKIAALPKNKQNEFYDILQDYLCDGDWCRGNGLNFAQPDVRRAKTILYTTLYADSKIQSA